MKIETSHDGYQHLATTSNYDGPGSPIGTSRESEQEAVADLKEQLADDPEWWLEIAEQDFAREIYKQCAREDAARNAHLPRRETIHLRAANEAEPEGIEGTGEYGDE